MIWLSWRQHRMQLSVTAGILAVLAALMLPSGASIASYFRSSGLASCLAVPGKNCGDASQLFSSHYTGLSFTVPLFLVLPVFIGIFWGAPLVSREIERGTYRLAWTQSISRTGWAVTNIVILSGSAVLAAGALAWLVTWWSQYFVASSDDRLSPGVFDLRGVVPVAYTLFALAAGVAAGTFIRKTLPAMLASVGIYGAVRIAIDLWVRKRYATPLTIDYSFFAKGDPHPGSGDWMLSTKTLDAAGHLLGNGSVLDFNILSQRCPSLIPPAGSAGAPIPPSQPAVQQCIQEIGLHIQSVYQPGSRFWSFQLTESAIFVALSLLVFALVIWRIRTRVG